MEHIYVLTLCIYGRALDIMVNIFSETYFIYTSNNNIYMLRTLASINEHETVCTSHRTNALGK